MATRRADLPLSVRANRYLTKNRLPMAYNRTSDQKIAKADRGISASEIRRSKATSTRTEAVTPIHTVNMERGPMKRMTARYRPSSEKTTNAELTATRK